jgi:hypothetical protein
MDSHTIATAGSGILQAVSTTLSTIKTARELAKDVKDNKLKEAISDAYDSLLDLKDRLLTLDEENRSLKAKLANKARFTEPEPPHGYLYRVEDTGKEYPLCPVCFHKGEGVYYLSSHPYTGGLQRRCKHCKWLSTERDANSPPPQSMSRRSYTPGR